MAEWSDKPVHGGKDTITYTPDGGDMQHYAHVHVLRNGREVCAKNRNGPPCEIEERVMAEKMGYAAMAIAVDHTRETTRALVASLVHDGFTDEQARDIVAGMFRSVKVREESD